MKIVLNSLLVALIAITLTNFTKEEPWPTKPLKEEKPSESRRNANDNF